MKCLVIVCMVLLPVEGLELRASGWRQRRNRASGVHIDRRTDGFPTVRLRCSHLLGLVSQQFCPAIPGDTRANKGLRTVNSS